MSNPELRDAYYQRTSELGDDRTLQTKIKMLGPKLTEAIKSLHNIPELIVDRIDHSQRGPPQFHYRYRL